jgi:hypothetical protein
LPTPPNPFASVFDDDVDEDFALVVVDETILVGEVVVVAANDRVKSVIGVAVVDVVTDDGVEVVELAVVDNTDG